MSVHSVLNYVDGWRQVMFLLPQTGPASTTKLSPKTILQVGVSSCLNCIGIFPCILLPHRSGYSLTAASAPIRTIRSMQGRK